MFDEKGRGGKGRGRWRERNDPILKAKTHDVYIGRYNFYANLAKSKWFNPFKLRKTKLDKKL